MEQRFIARETAVAKDTVSVLESLVEICRDGQLGFREAAEHAKDPSLRTFLNEQSLERAQFAGELESEIQHLGEPDPKRTGTVGGTLHRTWLDLKTALGGGDHSILSAVETGEDAAKRIYGEALADPLPENLRSIVARQAARVQMTHDRVKALRDQAQAA